jgi:phytoene dehydrogenase-like protein
MTSNQYDAIIIGGGHNGLVAGGAAVTEEIFPGYKFTEFSNG